MKTKLLALTLLVFLVGNSSAIVFSVSHKLFAESWNYSVGLTAASLTWLPKSEETKFLDLGQPGSQNREGMEINGRLAYFLNIGRRGQLFPGLSLSWIPVGGRQHQYGYFADPYDVVFHINLKPDYIIEPFIGTNVVFRPVYLSFALGAPQTCFYYLRYREYNIGDNYDNQHVTREAWEKVWAEGISGKVGLGLIGRGFRSPICLSYTLRYSPVEIGGKSMRVFNSAIFIELFSSINPAVR